MYSFGSLDYQTEIRFGCLWSGEPVTIAGVMYNDGHFRLGLLMAVLYPCGQHPPTSTMKARAVWKHRSDTDVLDRQDLLMSQTSATLYENIAEPDVPRPWISWLKMRISNTTTTRLASQSCVAVFHEKQRYMDLGFHWCIGFCDKYSIATCTDRLYAEGYTLAR